MHLECIEDRQSLYEAHGFQRIPLRQAPLGLRLKATIHGRGVAALPQAGHRHGLDRVMGLPAVLADQRRKSHRRQAFLRHLLSTRRTKTST